MREPTKDQLVLIYFLTQGNKLAGADTIVRWTEGKEPGTRVTVLNDRTTIKSSLSRAGAVKVLKRLAIQKYLAFTTSSGYRSKKVIQYQLQKSDKAFIATAHRFVGAPMIFLSSDYCKESIDSIVLPMMEKALRISLETERGDASWALARSPTALFLALDDTLKDGSISKIPEPRARKEAFLEVLSCAIRIDEASKTRSQLIESGDLPARFNTSSKQFLARVVNK